MNKAMMHVGKNDKDWTRSKQHSVQSSHDMHNTKAANPHERGDDARWQTQQRLKHQRSGTKATDCARSEQHIVQPSHNHQSIERSDDIRNDEAASSHEQGDEAH